MLFRGLQDVRVVAYDFNTGKRLWQTTIGDPNIGETTPAARIGNIGQDHAFPLGKLLEEIDRLRGALLDPDLTDAPIVDGGILRPDRSA